MSSKRVLSMSENAENGIWPCATSKRCRCMHTMSTYEIIMMENRCSNMFDNCIFIEHTTWHCALFLHIAVVVISYTQCMTSIFKMNNSNFIRCSLSPSPPHDSMARTKNRIRSVLLSVPTTATNVTYTDNILHDWSDTHIPFRAWRIRICQTICWSQQKKNQTKRKLLFRDRRHKNSVWVFVKMSN